MPIQKTSCADEILNEGKRVYRETVRPSLKRIVNEFIPQWKESLRTLDWHEYKMRNLETKVVELEIELKKVKRLGYENHKRINSLKQPEELSQTITDIEAEGKILDLYKTTDKPLYYIDIAEMLNMPLKQVVRIVEDLEERGDVEEVTE